jgi:hypothetical protein
MAAGGGDRQEEARGMEVENESGRREGGSCVRSTDKAHGLLSGHQNLPSIAMAGCVPGGHKQRPPQDAHRTEQINLADVDHLTGGGALEL